MSEVFLKHYKLFQLYQTFLPFFSSVTACSTFQYKKNETLNTLNTCWLKPQCTWNLKQDTSFVRPACWYEPMINEAIEIDLLGDLWIDLAKLNFCLSSALNIGYKTSSNIFVQLVS